MELRHLRYFVAVAELENVSRAAQKLHLSQPALSRQIRDLEEELGFGLLERGARSVRLTGAGRVFLEEARAVLERAGLAVEKGRAAARGSEERLDVGYAPSPTAQVLPRALRRFQQTHPRVRVILHDLSAEEMRLGVAAGGLALALTVRPLGRLPDGLRFLELTRYFYCVAVPLEHPWARSRAVDLAQASRASLLGYSRKDYPDYYAQMDRLFRSCPRQPRIVEEHDSVTSLIAGIEAGHGPAIVLSCIACLAGSRLRLIPLRPPGEPAVVGVLLSRKAPAIVDAFAQAALSAAASGGEPGNQRDNGGK